jgi:hypothetical protein
MRLLIHVSRDLVAPLIRAAKLGRDATPAHAARRLLREALHLPQPMPPAARRWGEAFEAAKKHD